MGQTVGQLRGPRVLYQDDGDRSFNKGVISNRLDLFSEFEVTYKNNFGARVSAAAWYDTIYNRSNDNNSPSTFNQLSVPYNQFTTTARDLDGRKAEILDGFVFAGAEDDRDLWPALKKFFAKEGVEAAVR